VGSLKVTAGAEAELDALIEQALAFGQGTLKLVTARDETIFSTERACPGVGEAFGTGPRLFSYNSKHGWCQGCFGTGLALAGFDEEQTGEESAWLDPDEEGELRTAAAAMAGV